MAAPYSRSPPPAWSPRGTPPSPPRPCGDNYVHTSCPLVKTLSPIGNRLGLIIDKPILDLLGIARDTPLEIKTDGEALIIRPIRAKDSAVADSAGRMMDTHAETLRKLALRGS